MGGGAGVEYYFGYKFAENDLVCEDWRSRDQSWDYCRIALDFFRDNDLPIHEMEPLDELVGNVKHDNSRYCFAKPGEVHLVYLPFGDRTEFDLSNAQVTMDTMMVAFLIRSTKDRLMYSLTVVVFRRCVALLFFLALASGVPTLSIAQYDGRDVNAAWRTEAAAKIDQHRKADLNVVAKLSDGTVLDSANINVSMQRVISLGLWKSRRTRRCHWPGASGKIGSLLVSQP